MVSSLCVRLLVTVLLNSGVVRASYNDRGNQPAQLRSRFEQQQMEYGDLTDTDDGADAYSYAESVAKRSNKGSCTCTCETEPVVVEAPALAASGRAQNSVSFMRTASRLDSPGPSKGNSIETAPASKTNHIDKARHDEKLAANSLKSVYEEDERLRDEAEPVVLTATIGADKQTATNSGNTKTSEAISGVRDKWGHVSRFPWKRLPDTMCFRRVCTADKDCCLKFSICDRSALVCVDCWYGSTCMSEQQCCHKYPYCQRVWKTAEDGQSYVASGKCVNKL